MTVPAPRSSHTWSVQTLGLPLLTHRVPSSGRTLSIEPEVLRISLDPPGGLVVVIDGATLKKNGSHGQHDRSHLYVETPHPALPNLTFDDLPDWARPYVDYVRALHSAPGHEDIALAIYQLNPATQPWNGDAYGFNERGAGGHRKLALRQAEAVLATQRGDAR
jgi:hypothetical protein